VPSPKRLRSFVRRARQSVRFGAVLSSPVTTTALIVLILAGISVGLGFALTSESSRPGFHAEPTASPEVSTSSFSSASPSPSVSSVETPVSGPTSSVCDTEPGAPCPSGAPTASGIPREVHIAITTDLSDPEPTVGEVLTITTEVYNPFDPYCCAFEMSVTRDHLPVLNDCASDTPAAGLTLTGGKLTRSIRWKVQGEGNWYVNVHAKGRCGSPGGSEQNGWISFQTKGWGTHPYPSTTPSPDLSPSVTPAESPTPTGSP